ncbi:uncharacterized protein EDB93DRAFT_1085906 [Suillus bovinus]|uniref:uncharacterized protein n=1 Tax=Suillus bovinus TaxID=48563 RepID=UPI001B870020|nr:uncharacterized protein EDB93DRAFT_1085906 [Suillus bovinus]KAG2146853.1 hypothetical protein EDB93DRAFT_1085906 [Suillus bovinus]
MPAERVRHAKRLGHVQPVNDPYASPLVFAKDATTNSTTTTSQSATLTTTSTTSTTPVAVSSTAKTSSSQSSVPTSSSASSQTLTSSASLHSTLISPSATVPTNGPVDTGTGLTTSPSHTTSQSVVIVTTTSSASSTAINNVSSASSQTLSSGALGGIIAASVVVALALVIFIIRKTYLRRRQNRRLSWPAGNIFNETKPLPAAPVDDFSEKPASLRNSPMSPFEAHGHSQYQTPLQPPIQRMQSPFTGYAGPAPPPASYNNPMNMYSQAPPPPSLSPGDSAVAMARTAVEAHSYSPPAPAATTATEAVVNRVFIPTLPDELSVTAGERIRVLAQYDDAWALCANGRGEQGMVPQECLDRLVASNQPDWRNAGRTSSLVSDGRRY